MNLEQIIFQTLMNCENFEEVEDIARSICNAVEPQLRIIVEMRYAQRAYFRRKNEDNLSKAKKLEKLTDELLEPIDIKRQLVIQPDLLIF